MPPSPIEFNDFSKGWIPSDDSASGRKNGLLQMDNLELDKNGALSLIGGTTVVGSAYGNPTQVIYSNVLGSTRHDYVADNTGKIFRDGTQIASGGDTENTAFGNAFGQTLIASGDTRKKDIGSGTPTNLGLTAPNNILGIPQQNFAVGITPRFLVPFNLATGKANIINLSPKAAVTGLTIVSCVPYNSNLDGSSDNGFLVTTSTPITSDFLVLGAALFIAGSTNSFYNTAPGSAESINYLVGLVSPTSIIIGRYVPPSTGNGTGGTLSIVFQPNATFQGGANSKLAAIYCEGDTIVQTTTVDNAPIDLSQLNLYNPATTLTGTPNILPDTFLLTSDWSNISVKNQLAADQLKLKFDFANGPANASNIISVTFDFLLVQPDAVGTQVSDYYRCVYLNETNSNARTLLATFNRGDFIKVGFKNVNWKNVYGYRITIATASVGISGLPPASGAGITTAPILPFYVLRFDFCSLTSNVGQLPNDPVGPCFENGLSSKTVLNTALPTDVDNPIEWAAMYVNDNGLYQAKSTLGPAQIYSTAGVLLNPTDVNTKLTLELGYPILQTQSPADPQSTHIWIFRRGASLAQWYRVLVLPISSSSTIFIDDLSDQDAITLGITVNLNLVSLTSDFGHKAIVNKIIDIIGPIEGRWFYFTNNTMYPSDINNPDLVDVSLAVRTTSASEDFLWARKVADAAVLVGTYKEVYLLTGTFQTLPDFTIDIYYRGLGCKFPPIVHMATSGNGQVFYLSSDGWRAIDAEGNNPLLVVPNTDRLYRGITCYGYSVNVQQVPGQMAFPCVLARNKLWCSITGQHRIEVYDSVRNYWRSFDLGLGDCTAITATQDGNILATFAADKKLRLLDVQSSNLIDGTVKQTVNILSPIMDGGNKRNRKELYTLKIKVNTGGDSLICRLIADNGTSYLLGTVSSTSLVDTFLDVPSSGLELSKWWQYQFTGSFGTLSLSDIGLTVEPRPEPVTFRRIFNQNFGNASKKRLRVWPYVIDTLGNTVLFTPVNDNVDGTTTSIQTSEKTTVRLFYKTDVFAVDYGMKISTPNGGMFELWEPMDPDIVQTLPIARQFDQVGPEEFFRYGRVKQFEIRVQPFGGTVLPWTMYFNDNSVVSGSIAMLDGKEQSYFIGVPMKAAGTIVRMVFGPTAFDFHRFYVRLQVAKTGRDTEMEWVSLPDPAAGE